MSITEKVDWTSWLVSIGYHFIISVRSPFNTILFFSWFSVSLTRNSLASQSWSTSSSCMLFLFPAGLSFLLAIYGYWDLNLAKKIKFIMERIHSYFTLKEKKILNKVLRTIASCSRINVSRQMIICLGCQAVSCGRDFCPGYVEEGATAFSVSAALCWFSSFWSVDDVPSNKSESGVGSGVGLGMLSTARSQTTPLYTPAPMPINDPKKTSSGWCM